MPQASEDRVWLRMELGLLGLPMPADGGDAFAERVAIMLDGDNSMAAVNAARAIASCKFRESPGNSKQHQ